MTNMHFLPELVLILGIGVIAALGVGFFRLPAVAGFMIAGAVAGPSGLALIHEREIVDVLAEIGVILLLFTIGLEFSLDRLRRIWRLVAIGGSLQVGLTVTLCVGVALVAGDTASRGIFLGFLVALSSTAIVLRGLAERGEVDAPHGRFTIGALIFQDLSVVPMMLLIPILAGKADGSPVLSVVMALGKAALFVVVALGAGRFLVPRVLKRVDAAKSREVFLLAVLVVCAGVAVLTAFFGLSLALGAFLAGILLSESAYGQRAMANVLPLRDLLTTLFFMSLGMLFDVSVLREQPLVVACVFAAMFFGKGLIATLASLAMKFPARVAMLAGVSLAQFGEFGFVLAKEGGQVGLLTAGETRVLLAAGLLTMFVTPLSMRLAPHFAAGARLLRPLERLLGARGIDEAAAEHHALAHHVVVAGHGLGGRLLTRALADAEIPYVVLELDAENVRTARLRGDPVYYADVTSDEALTHAHLADADALVLLISDEEATRRAIAVARQVAPAVPILVRARRADSDTSLRKLGATDVVTEEFEAGIEMLARVLRTKNVPINVLGASVRLARAEGSATARKTVFPRNRIGEVRALDELKVESVILTAAMSAVGRTIGDLHVRSSTGALVLALRREGKLFDDVDPHVALAEGDILYLAGVRENVYRALQLLETGVAPAPAPDDDAEPLRPPLAPIVVDRSTAESPAKVVGSNGGALALPTSHASSSGAHSRRGIAVFLAVTFALSWVPAFLLREVWRSGEPFVTQLLSSSLLYAVTMGWQPVLAMWLARRFGERRFAPLDAGLREVRPPFLLIATLAPFAVALVAGAVAVADGTFGASVPATLNGHVEDALRAPAPSLSLFAATAAFAITVVLLAGQAFNEELGWRGYFMTRLIDRFGVRVGLVVHGVVWGVWYSPIFLVSNTDLSRSALHCALFVVTCCLLGTALGWLRLASNSIVAPTVANAVLTMVAGLPFVLRGLDAGLRSMAYAPAGWLPLLLLLAVLTWGPGRAALTPRAGVG